MRPIVSRRKAAQVIEFAGETGREHVGAVVLDALHDGPLRVSPHDRVAAQAPRGLAIPHGRATEVRAVRIFDDSNLSVPKNNRMCKTKMPGNQKRPSKVLRKQSKRSPRKSKGKKSGKKSRARSARRAVTRFYTRDQRVFRSGGHSGINFGEIETALATGEIKTIYDKIGPQFKKLKELIVDKPIILNLEVGIWVRITSDWVSFFYEEPQTLSKPFIAEKKYGDPSTEMNIMRLLIHYSKIKKLSWNIPVGKSILKMNNGTPYIDEEESEVDVLAYRLSEVIRLSDSGPRVDTRAEGVGGVGGNDGVWSRNVLNFLGF